MISGRKPLIIKMDGDDMRVNFDIATRTEDKQKIANTIIEVLAIYGLEYTIVEKGLGNFLVLGFADDPLYYEVKSEILESYNDYLLSLSMPV